MVFLVHSVWNRAKQDMIQDIVEKLNSIQNHSN